MAALKGDLVTFIIIFFGVMVAAVLLASVADETFLQTNLINPANTTITAPANNASIDLVGRGNPSALIVYNATGDPGQTGNNGTGDISTGNFTIGQNLSSSTGLLTVELRTADVLDTKFAGRSINISYTAEPNGFVSGGTASITLLIVLFGALGALIFVIVMLFQPGSSTAELIRGKLGMN